MSHVDPELVSLFKWALGGMGTIMVGILGLTLRLGAEREKMRQVYKAVELLETLAPRIDQLAKDVAQVVAVQAKHTSDWPKFKEEVRQNVLTLDKRLYRSETKLGLTSAAGYQRARFGSQSRIPRGDDEGEE